MAYSQTCVSLSQAILLKGYRLNPFTVIGNPIIGGQMELSCRQANLKNVHDQQDIVSLLNDFFMLSSPAKPLSEDVRATLIENLENHPTTEIYLAEYENRAIGIAVCFIGFSTFMNKSLLNLHDFYIKDEYQGNGFGKVFLNHIEKMARNKGYCRITLEVYAKNKRAIAIYEECGYSGSRQDYPEHLMFALSKKL